jgi:uncharacterized protein
MQKGVVTFEDLHEGMRITGKIKNVVDFGAFVDLGIKETALVHVSEMSDHFVRDPLAAVKVGDVLEFRIISLDRDRRRIGLSRKNEGTPPPRQEKRVSPKKEHGVIKETAPERRPAAPPRRPVERASPGPAARDNDGTMYNPFAEAFRKMRDGK